MYTARVPRITIYVDRELARKVRLRGLPISRVCQDALREQVELAERGKAPRYVKRPDSRRRTESQRD